MSTAKFTNWRLDPDLIPRAPRTVVRADVVDEASEGERLSARALVSQFLEGVRARGLVPIADAAVSATDDAQHGSVLGNESRYTAEVQVEAPREDFRFG